MPTVQKEKFARISLFYAGQWKTPRKAGNENRYFCFFSLAGIDFVEDFRPYSKNFFRVLQRFEIVQAVKLLACRTLIGISVRRSKGRCFEVGWVTALSRCFVQENCSKSSLNPECCRRNSLTNLLKSYNSVAANPG